MNPLDVAVAQVAARQRSLVHRDQALAPGMTVRQFQARSQLGLYVRAQRNVFRLEGRPVTWEQQVLAACAKLNRLLGRGWRVLQFTGADIRYLPDRVVGELTMAA